MLRPKHMNVPTLELEGRARKRAKIESKPPHEALFSGLDGVCRTPDWGEEELSKAGVHTVQRIGSMERFFGSQSLASPPADVPEAQAPDPVEQDSEDATPERQFTISYSQHYARPQSLQNSPANSQGSPAQEAIADREEGPAAQAAAGEGATSSGSGRVVAVGSKRGPLAALQEEGEDKVTPELAVGTPVGRSKLFPVFRRRGDYKGFTNSLRLWMVAGAKAWGMQVVHLIRHGESEFNAAASSSKSWEDPQIYNPNLTIKGQAQARKLKGLLQSMKLGPKALWVSSPLARAMQTMVLACPQAELLGRNTADQGFRTAIRGESSEHLMTTGDIGAPTSHLKEKFPQFSAALEPLPERWWYMPQANDAVKRQCTSYESKRHLVERVGQFRRWLQEQPERVIVVFGHSTFLRQFIGGGKHLKNCELFTLHL